MYNKMIFFIIICILSVCSAEVFADTLHLKNGNKVSGIITKENENSVEIKINIGATVSFSKQDIERIERDWERGDKSRVWLMLMFMKKFST